MSDYEPDPKTAKLFARYKQAAEIIRTDKRAVLAAAEEAMRQGAKSPELAALTGMSGQTFRTLAEKIGVDVRTKPPTVGPEAEARRAQAASGDQTAPLLTTLAMPRPPAVPADIDERVLGLSEAAVLALSNGLRDANPGWHQAAIKPTTAKWKPFRAVSLALAEGKLTDADLTAE